ncbi:MAG: hypothetical protein OEU36_17450, partial [Gammaproteobacteria bacterium]|nr:hypothetical protein [Gammaproteobacteria bacterium]
FDAQFNDGVSVWGMEAESITLPAVTSGSSYVSVSFRRSYSTPPVITVLPTTENPDPATIRIRNVTTTGFEAAQVEPASQDGTQGAMTMHYVAVQPGTHELPDGTRVLAGTVSTNVSVHGTGVSGTEATISVNYPIWPGTSGGGGTSPLPDSQVLTYDANGNRASINEDLVLYNYSNLANTNRLLSTTGPTAKTYSHDLAGNVTSDGIHSYGYDDRGRLVDVDSGATTYQHNGQGQRVKKDNSTITLFVYDEVGGLIGEYDSAGVVGQETVWFNGAPVAVLEGASVYYVHTDHLGSPRVISDGNTPIWRWQSDPFGSTAPDEDPDGDATMFTYNLRFPGQYYDAETGLNYNYFRTYDPSIGRYLESDPIGLHGGLNSFAYTEGNPLLSKDPFGLLSEDWSCTCRSGFSLGYVAKNANDFSTKICPVACDCKCTSDGTELPTIRFSALSDGLDSVGAGVVCFNQFNIQKKFKTDTRFTPFRLNGNRERTEYPKGDLTNLYMVLEKNLETACDDCAK